MKTIILFITVMATCISIYSQGRDSCTCIPNSQLRQAARIYERYKIYRQMDSINRASLDSAYAALSGCDTIITYYKTLDANSQVIILNQYREIKNAAAQRDLTVTYNDQLKSALKKEKIKKWLFGSAGVIITGIILKSFK